MAVDLVVVLGILPAEQSLGQALRPNRAVRRPLPLLHKLDQHLPPRGGEPPLPKQGRQSVRATDRLAAWPSPEPPHERHKAPHEGMLAGRFLSSNVAHNKAIARMFAMARSIVKHKWNAEQLDPMRCIAPALSKLSGIMRVKPSGKKSADCSWSNNALLKYSWEHNNMTPPPEAVCWHERAQTVCTMTLRATDPSVARSPFSFWDSMPKLMCDIPSHCIDNAQGSHGRRSAHGLMVLSGRWLEHSLHERLLQPEACGGKQGRCRVLRPPSQVQGADRKREGQPHR